MRQLLDTRTVYLCPRLNPDGAELALADRPRHIRSSTRPYPFDEPVDGLTVEDVDGDGRVLYMRIPDPHGPYKKHDHRPAADGGARARRVRRRVLPADARGHAEELGRPAVKVNKDREGLDLNRNFPAYWRQEFEQVGAGPYPTSEPEVRAMVDFIVTHPNIGAASASTRTAA
jgi:murein tripeptide amidase MpaA